MAERRASNADVAGSLPVGRSISERVVDHLIEDDEVDDFMSRNADAIHVNNVIDALDTCGLAHDRIEHIEIQPCNERGSCAPEEATKFRLDVYGAQRGKIDDRTFYLVSNFNSFERALDAARIIQGILGDLEIRFDGFSPSLPL